MSHFVLDARTATPHYPGIGRYVVQLTRALASCLAAGDQLTLLCDPSHRLALPPLDRVQSIPVAVSPFSLAQQIAVPRLLQHLGADLYHSPYYLMPYRPGVPTVLTVHDLIPIHFPEQSTTRARLLFRHATALALRAACHVIAVSEATRQDVLAQFGIQPVRITAISHAADPAFRPQPPEVVGAVLARHALPTDYALYLGSNKPHKNLLGLVEAWGMLRPQPVPLIIAGAWDPRYPAPRQRAEALGLGDSIRWLGPVAEPDLPALYSGALLFVFPSLYEGFGLPVLEAMACGAAVVCSNSSSLPEVASGAALLTDPTDTSKLAATLAQVLGDASLRREMREKGLARAQFFTWEQTARHTLDVYRS